MNHFPRQKQLTTRRRLWYGACLAPAVVGPIWAVVVPEIRPATLLGTVSGFVLCSLLVVCSYTDTRWKRIPNWATYSALLWAVALNCLGLLGNAAGTADTGPVDVSTWEASAVIDVFWGSIGLVPSLTGAAACFLAMLVIYRIAGSGGGDVKLAAAIGALVGPATGLTIILVCHLITGTLILCWLVWRIGPWNCLCLLGRTVGYLLLPLWILPPRFQERQLLLRPVPLAAFFAVATGLVITGVIV